MNKKVKHVLFRETSNFIPVVGDIGKHLPSQSKTLKNLSMHVSSVGVHINFDLNGKERAFLFPQSAIQFVELDNELPENVVKLKGK